MATRFEIALHGEDPSYLHAAAEAALDEIERLEEQLSFYRPTSELSFINTVAAHQPVKVETLLYALLTRARDLSAETLGTFDPTVGGLMKLWGLTGDAGRRPSEDERTAALERTGIARVDFDDAARTIRFPVEGMQLDLGSIGKGYALDEAARILRDEGVENGLVQGGTSAVFAWGRTPAGDPWRVAIAPPVVTRDDSEAAALIVRDAEPENGPPLAVVELEDESLSVSAVSGKYFRIGVDVFGHVIDPRSGLPVNGPLLAATVLPSATDADALSTALLTLGESGLDVLKARETARGLVLLGDDQREFDVMHLLRMTPTAAFAELADRGPSIA
jgi:thiamine biosynthesis lipoprotein